MKKREEALFELVRKAPTELSQEKVMQIIGTLPTLPPPGGNSWFNNINLNSIIMTTTTVAIIASAVIYFSNPTTENPDLGQEPVSPAPVEISEPIQPATAADDSIEAIKRIPEPASIMVQSNDSLEKMELVTQEHPPTKPAIKTAEPIAVVPTPDSIRPTNTKPPSLVSQSSETVVETVAATPPVTTSSRIDEEPTAWPAKGEIIAPARKVGRIDDLRLKRLKRTLLRELSRDLLINSKRALNVLHFKEGEIVVNNQKLGIEEFTKYSELLFKFRIEPGPNKRVVTDPKFVMVGSFTDRGFKGSVHGRAADLKFVNDAVILKGLLDENGNPQSGPQGVILFDEPEVAVQPGDILVNTEGETKNAEVNISGLNRLLSDSLGLSGISNLEAETVNFKNAATISTIFEEGSESTPVKMSTNQVRNFKKELYKMLIADDQVESRSSPVNMLISPDLFKVNENSGFENLLVSKYSRLFNKYDLTPGLSRRILMNSDFIMIGDFDNGQFNGTAQGTIQRERLKGTVLEEEMNRSKIFGGNDELPTASEEREIAAFDRIRASGLAVVYLQQGPHKPLRLEVSGIALDQVITESRNGVLNVSTKADNIEGESISIYVSSPDVHTIWADGAAEVFSQGMFKADILKLISQESASIEMAVDVNRLHLQMDGGDVHLEGKALMEKVEFLPESVRGTLDQSGLNITERWTHEGGSTWTEQNLPNFRQAILSKLIEQGYISTMQNPASIRLYNNRMTVNGHKVAPNYLEEYKSLFKTYGLPAHADSRLWIDPDFMIVAEKDGKFFELEVMGTELELNIEGSWAELEDAIFHR